VAEATVQALGGPSRMGSKIGTSLHSLTGIDIYFEPRESISGTWEIISRGFAIVD
jgi:hypothetical protein